MQDSLQQIENRYLEMEHRSTQPDFYNDPAAAAKLLREQRELEPIVTAYRRLRQAQQAWQTWQTRLCLPLRPRQSCASS